MSLTELFSILDSIDSTNNYAMAKVHAGLARHGMACFAREQTSGKGQRGKSWHTGRDENIALSIVIEPSWLNPSRQFEISVAVALGCYDFFVTYAGNSVTVKWPNDIYWRDRKAGGILIENLISGNRWNYAVAGIGININKEGFDEQLKNAISLKQITAKTFDCITLANQLHSAVMNRLNLLEAGGFNEQLRHYNDALYGKGKITKFKKGNIVFEGRVERVTRQGQLVVFNGVETEYDFGEISWIL